MQRETGAALVHPYADARVIATLCGAALVVGRKDKTRVDAVNGLLKKLENKRTVVAGVVMNEN